MDLIQTQHVLTAPDGGQVQVTRLASGQADTGRPPLVALAGMFCGHRFWLSPRQVGLAAYLARQGFTCYLIDRRGIGPMRVQSKGRAGYDELLTLDLPMVQRWVQDQERRPAVWMGHSFGGVVLARAVAETLERDQVAGLVLFAAQCEQGLASMRPPISYLLNGIAGVLGRFPSRRLGLGPDDEPRAAMEDACRWTRQAQRRSDFFDPLALIRAPVLALAGAGDKSDPPEGCRQLVAHMVSAEVAFAILGRASGFAEDYSHTGLVVSKAAQREIWPRVVQWLDQAVQESAGHAADSVQDSDHTLTNGG